MKSVRSQEAANDPELDIPEDVRDRYGLVRAMLDGAGDALFCKDRDGKYLLLNAQGTRMLGMSVGDVIGRSDSAFFAREQAEQIRASDDRVVATREPLSFEEVLDFQGIPTHVLTTKRPWMDPFGLESKMGCGLAMSPSTSSTTPLCDSARALAVFDWALRVKARMWRGGSVLGRPRRALTTAPPCWPVAPTTRIFCRAMVFDVERPMSGV